MIRGRVWENVFGFVPLTGSGSPVSVLALLPTLKKDNRLVYVEKGCPLPMIAHKYTQRVGLLEPSLPLLAQENVEDSSSDEMTETTETTATTHHHHANEEDMHGVSPNLYTLSPNCDEYIRQARVAEIKAQLAKDQYHVDPHSLAQAIYREHTKRQRKN